MIYHYYLKKLSCGKFPTEGGHLYYPQHLSGG